MFKVTTEDIIEANERFINKSEKERFETKEYLKGIGIEITKEDIIEANKRFINKHKKGDKDDSERI